MFPKGVGVFGLALTMGKFDYLWRRKISPHNVENS